MPAYGQWPSGLERLGKRNRYAFTSREPSGLETMAGWEPIAVTSSDKLNDDHPASGTDNVHSPFYPLVREYRETIGVNRLAIFISPPFSPFRAPNGQDSRLPCITSIGIPSDGVARNGLSSSQGIGKWVMETGSVLRRSQAPAGCNAREFADLQEDFGSQWQIAVPISDRERTIGVALLGDPLTGQTFSEEELLAIFRLLENFAAYLAYRRQASRLATENQLQDRILSSLPSGVILVTEDLAVLKANAAIKDFLGYSPDAQLSFCDIPENLAAQIRGAIENKEACPPFLLSFPRDKQKRRFRVTLVPITEDYLPDSFFLMATVEDFTEIDTATSAAVQAVTARLTMQMQLLHAQ